MIHERDRHTDRQTPHDGIGRAYAQHHVAMTSCPFSRWRILAILDFRGSITGSWKSPCTTFYRLSIETIALNYLVFEKKLRLCILATDRQTNRQTNRWTAPKHWAALAITNKFNCPTAWDRYPVTVVRWNVLNGASILFSITKVVFSIMPWIFELSQWWPPSTCFWLRVWDPVDLQTDIVGLCAPNPEGYPKCNNLKDIWRTWCPFIASYEVWSFLSQKLLCRFCAVWRNTVWHEHEVIARIKSTTFKQ